MDIVRRAMGIFLVAFFVRPNVQYVWMLRKQTDHLNGIED